MVKSYRTICFILAVCIGGYCNAGMVTLEDHDTGWFTNDGWNFNSTANVVVSGATGTGTDTGRGFMTFDMSAFTGEITSASLAVIIDAYPNGTAEKKLRLYDFTSGLDNRLTINHPINSPDGIAIFNDLGNGQTYSQELEFINPFFPPSNGTAVGDTVTISLNQNAVDSLNAANGLWTIGFADNSSGFGNTQDGTIRFRAGGAYANQLILETAPVPEPSHAYLFAMCLLFFLLSLRKTRRPLAIQSVA